MDPRRPVYSFHRGSVYGDCPVCHTMTQVSGLRVAMVGRWIEIIVPIKGTTDEHTVKRIFTRKKVQVCPCCADRYDAMYVHSNASRYEPALEVEPKRGDTPAKSRRPIIRL